LGTYCDTSIEQESEMSLKEKYIRNSFFNVIGWVWITLLSIITVPIVIHHIGIEQYGILALVFLLLGYFAFLDLGLGEAVVKFVSEYYSKGNVQQINGIINSILFIYIIIGLIGVSFIIFFTRFYALKLFKISPQYAQVARASFYLAAIGFFLNLIMAVFSKIPEGIQRFDITSKIMIVLGTLTNLGNIIVVLRGGKLFALVIVNLCGTILGIFLYYAFSKAIFKNLKINFRFSWQDFKKTFSFGVYTVFTKLAAVVSLSLFQIIIGIILGPVSVAIYNVPAKLLSRLQIFANKMSYVVFPMVSELKADNHIDRIHRIYEKLSKYMFFIISVFCISAVSFSYHILNYWIGNDFAEKGFKVFILLAFAYYLHSISIVPSLVVNGMGKPKYNAVFSMLNGIISIILLIFLSRKSGIVGSATAFLISSFNVPVFILIVNKYILKFSSIKYIKNVFLKGSIISVLLISIYLLVFNRLVRDLWSFLFVFLVSLLITALIFYFNVDIQDRKAILSKIRILNFVKY
jgi:O-antigen/teichoic acid export membrane protein